MEFIAMLAVVGFFAVGSKREDASMKIMLISKMFTAVAAVIFVYMSLLYAKYAIMTRFISEKDQVSQPKNGLTTSNLSSFLQIESLDELYPLLTLLAVSSAAALIMYLVSKGFARKGN